MTTSGAFNIPSPKQWIDEHGAPTLAFYKFIVNLFNQTAGAGTATGTIQSNISGGVAPPVGNTLSEILDALISNTAGDLIQRGASLWGSTTIFDILDASLGSARGDIAVRDATAWTALALGSTGKALVSDGTDLAYALVASLAATVTLAAGAPSVITTAGGDLKLDSATHNLQLGTTAALATVAAAFVADHRIQIKDGAGTTYYIAVSNVAW